MRSRFVVALAITALLADAAAIAATAQADRHIAVRVSSIPGPAPSSGPVASAGPTTGPTASATGQQELDVELGAPLPTSVASGLVSLSMESQLFNEGAVASPAPSLIALLRTLHPGRIRVGANTGDIQGLTPGGLIRLTALAKATSTPVVLGLPLVHFDPTAAARLAATAERALGPLLIAVEVGNESDAYGENGHPRSGTNWSFGTYLAERNAYVAALLAAGVRKPVWGPDNSRPGWLGQTAAAGGAGFAVLTPHFYALRGCAGHALSMATLLSGTLHQHEEQAAASFTQAGSRSGLPVVVGESNSGTCGGENGVSDRAGSALWAADLALLMSRAGALSVHFHIGLAGCRGYNPLCNPSTGPGFTDAWRPGASFAGLLLPSAVTGGRFLALQVVSTSGQVHNVRFYAVTMPDAHLRVVALDLDPVTDPVLSVRLSGQPGTVSSAATLVGGFAVPDYTGTTVVPLPVGGPSSLEIAPGQAKVWDLAP